MSVKPRRRAALTAASRRWQSTNADDSASEPLCVDGVRKETGPKRLLLTEAFYLKGCDGNIDRGVNYRRELRKNKHEKQTEERNIPF